MQTQQSKVGNNLYGNVVKRLLRNVLLVGGCVVGFNVYATDSMLPALVPSTGITKLPVVDPAAKTLCFPQTSIQQDLGYSFYNYIQLAYYVLVPPGYQGMMGDIYVALRQDGPSGRETLWLNNGGSWKLYDPAQGQPPVTYSTNSIPIKLAAIQEVYVAVDTKTYSNLKNMSVLVGYGLRNGANSTAADSYQEMLTSQRYRTIWYSPQDPPYTIQPGIADFFMSQLCIPVTNVQIQQFLGATVSTKTELAK